MMNLKIERVNSNLEREISYILANEIKDNNIKFVTVTSVKTTRDLGYAKVYVTVLNEEYKKETLAALKRAKGFVRKSLAERVDIRHIPDLEFVYDDSISYGNSIEEKIKEINEKK